MASANDNEDGILGNLPHSRPGVRSDKRDRSRPTPKKAPAAPKARKPAAPKAPPPPPPEPARSSDPIEQAVHLVGEVAETGIRAMAKVAGGVLRRLPKP